MRTYDPKAVQLVVGGSIIGGYADGSMIQFERDEDMFTKHVGTDGNVSRSKTNNRAGKYTITLAQTSPSNDILSGYMLLDELSNNGVVEVLLTDADGTTAIFSGQAWVMKPPGAEFAKEIGDRVWVLDAGETDVFIGGN